MERQIGEIFQDGEVTLKVVEVFEDSKSGLKLVAPSYDCGICFYLDIDNQCTKPINKCVPEERSDEASVIFVKQ